jgi:uncharacterized SAM-binding protein YcdF (DUF218 family)
MTFFCLLLLWLGGFIVFSRYIKSYPTDTMTKTEAVAVLTGGRNRIAEAVRLYNEGYARWLIISGLGGPIGIAELERQNHTKITAPLDHVILGKQATNTIENAIEIDEAIRRNQITSLRLVTSFYHLPRSQEEISARHPEITIIPHPVYSQYVSSRWWKRWGSFKLIASEYNKFIFVSFKHFILRLTERNRNDLSSLSNG